jgi:L-seryl-tRNA(Ser) seleniumtransferase
VPDVANHVPHMSIFWDPRKISLAPRDASKVLREGKPSIVIGGSENGLGMSSFMLKPGEEKIIAARLVELLKSHAA